jgi:hypothetical protein
VAEAMTAFEHLVRRHADDRGMFASMAESIREPREDLLDVKLRREYFRLASRIWGTHSRLSLRASLYVPGPTSNVMDGVSIGGAVDVVRLRPDATLHLRSTICHGKDDQPTPFRSITPGGEGDGTEGPGGGSACELLRPFCTQPMPELTHRRLGNQIITELRDQPLGKGGAFTYFVANRVRHFASEDDTGADVSPFESNIVIARPTTAVISDVLFYDGMFDSLKPTAAVYGNLARLGAYQHWERTESDRLPMKVSVESLGFGTAAMRPAEFPGGRYAEMIEHICERLRLDVERFEVFRCRVEYPILHSLLSVTFPLPKRGKW